MPTISDRLRAARVAPVIRTSDEASARRCVEILAEEGFRLFEITNDHARCAFRHP